MSENFAPGVMERWGLTYERLQELSPDVIYARMSGYGHSGPHAEYRSYGPVVQAMSGLSYISGLPGREPSGWGLSYMDNQAAYYNSTALLMAIYRRMRTGQGTEIDVSAIEAGINLVGPCCSTSRSTATRPAGPTSRPATGSSGRPPRRTASTRRWRGPLGRHRRVRRRPVGRSGRGARIPRHGPPTPASRRQEDRFRNQDVLDEHVSAWTRDRDRHDVMELLQRHGVPAGAVQNAARPQRERPTGRPPWRVLRDGPPGDRPGAVRGTPVQFSSIAQDNWRSGPCSARTTSTCSSRSSVSTTTSSTS